MARIQGKIGKIDTWRDPFAVINSSNDIMLRVNDGTKAIPLAQLQRGNVILISNAPNTLIQGLANINGYRIIEEVSIASTGGYNYIRLTTGNATKTEQQSTIISGAEVLINTATTDQRKSVAWKKDKAFNDAKLNEAAGKIENCRRIYKWIKNEIAPTAEAAIREDWHMTDFKNIIADIEDWFMYSEAAFLQCNSLKSSNNPFFKTTVNNGKDYTQAIADVYRMAYERLNAAESDFISKKARIEDWMHRSGMENLWQGTKTATLAPLRGFYLLMIKTNIAGMGAAIYGLKKQNPAKYEKVLDDWFKAGGNRTTMDTKVEAAKKHWDKKYSADGSSYMNCSYIDAMMMDTRNVLYHSAEGEGQAAGDNAGLDQATTQSLALAAQQSSETKTLKLPVGIGAAVAGGVTAATGGAAAPFAVPIGGFYEVVAGIVNRANIKIGKGDGSGSGTPGGDDSGTPPPDDEGNPMKYVYIIGGIGLAIGIGFGIAAIVKKTKK